MELDERVVGVLFETLGSCEEALNDIVWNLCGQGLSSPLGEDFDSGGGIQIEDRDDEVLLHLSQVLMVHRSPAQGPRAEYEFRVTAAVTRSGWRVMSSSEVRLAEAVPQHPPGRYVLQEKTSAVLEFEAAMTEFRSQTDAFDELADRLDGFGLVRVN